MVRPAMVRGGGQQGGRAHLALGGVPAPRRGDQGPAPGGGKARVAGEVPELADDVHPVLPHGVGADLQVSDKSGHVSLLANLDTGHSKPFRSRGHPLIYSSMFQFFPSMTHIEFSNFFLDDRAAKEPDRRTRWARGARVRRVPVPAPVPLLAPHATASLIAARRRPSGGRGTGFSVPGHQLVSRPRGHSASGHQVAAFCRGCGQSNAKPSFKVQLGQGSSPPGCSLAWKSEKGVRLAQSMQVGPCIPVGTRL
jgi:hypothetical protein